MGAWGYDALGNDTACDWSWELEKVNDLGLVRETLERVLDVADEYLDSDVASEALAACEVVARLKGNWGVRNAFTEPVDKWVESHKFTPPDDLVQASLAVIDRVVTPLSELLDTYKDPTEWRVAMEELRNRISA